MAKCMDRWADPSRGRSPSAQGPYMCGRQPGHKGVHAWDGNGAAALWSHSGELLMAIQVVNRPGGERGLAGLLDADETAEKGLG